MMTVASPRMRMTIDDLLNTPEKAELIRGRIVKFMPSGHAHGRIAFRVARSLDDYCEAQGSGISHGDGVGYRVPGLGSERESFSPDASYFSGPVPHFPNRFLVGPPDFAVEVRSENDYGPAAEREMAAKRADYFEAGMLAVWDVDPEAKWIRKYSATAPDSPVEFVAGQMADAEPAAPGWSVAVDWIFG